MAKQPAFTVEQLREYRGLMTRLTNATQQRMQLNLQIADLEEKEAMVDAEIEQLEALLGSKFDGLRQAEDLFTVLKNPGDEELAELEIEGTGYVKKETKEKLLRKIFADYRRANPQATAISYRDVKETLEQNYGIECRSIANFFVGMLDSYETVGGNRNKAIVLPKP